MIKLTKEMQETKEKVNELCAVKLTVTTNKRPFERLEND